MISIDLVIGVLSYSQLDFSRSCYRLSILQLEIIRSYHWVGLIFCSLLSIDLVTGLVKFSAARIRSILPQFAQFLAAGLISIDLFTDMVQLSAA